MKTYNKFLLCFAIQIALLLAGCIQSTPDVPIMVVSLREYYPILLENAQKWRPDAYLSDADISLYPSSKFLISASFLSPSENFESIGIFFLRDGTSKTEIYTQELPVLQHKPIAIEDWAIDSNEALDTMLDEDGRRFMGSGSAVCSWVRLERFLPLEAQPVIWTLNLSNCANAPRYIYLDARTGEALNLSRTIYPTRFPTPTP